MSTDRDHDEKEVQLLDELERMMREAASAFTSDKIAQREAATKAIDAFIHELAHPPRSSGVPKLPNARRR